MHIEKNIEKHIRLNGIKQKHLCQRTGIKETRLTHIFRHGGKMYAEELIYLCRELGLECKIDSRIFDGVRL